MEHQKELLKSMKITVLGMTTLELKKKFMKKLLKEIKCFSISSVCLREGHSASRWSRQIKGLYGKVRKEEKVKATVFA